MKQAVLLIALSFILGQCTNAAHRLAQKDLKVWCNIASHHNPNSYEDKVTGAVTYAQKVSDSIRSPEIMTIYKTINKAPTQEQLKLIYKGASDVGLDDFKCPGFERLYPPEPPKKGTAHGQ